MTRPCFLAGAGALAFIALPSLAMAQAAATTTLVDDVVVVANRAPQPLSKVGQSVTVLDAAAIKASQAIQVADLLVQTPGVTLSRNGGEGQPTQIFIRGADSEQTLVLIDGVAVNDPSQPGGGYDFSNLLMGDITRIEVLRGAQSTLWGSQAIGGVVDVMTALPTTTPQGDVAVEGGSRSTYDYRGDVGATIGGLSVRLAGGDYSTAGVSAFAKALGGKEPDGFHNAGFSGRVGYQFTPDVQLDLRGYYTRSRVAFDGYDTPTGQFGDDREYGRTVQYIVYAGLNFGLFDGRLKNRLAGQYADIDRRLYDPGLAAFGPTTETFYGYGATTRVEYQGDLAIADGYRLVFGAQHEHTSLLTDSPAYDFVPAPLSARADLDSGYAQIEGDVAPGLNLTGGVRYDQHSDFGGHLTGQASAAWSPNGGATVLRASFGQGFKAPSLYQLFSPYGTQTLKLRPLRPESANSWDVGVEQHLLDGRAVLSATWFGRDTHDLIAFVNGLPAAPNGAYANVEHASAEGVELQAEVKATPSLTLAANYTYTDAEDLTRHTTLLRRPRNTANATATYVWPFGLSTAVAVRYAGPSHDVGFDAAFNPIPITLKAYALVDLRVSYPITDRLEIYGRIENLFDRRYETAYQYGSLGRGMFAGVRARF